jgi:hypothetical protein
MPSKEQTLELKTLLNRWKQIYLAASKSRLEFMLSHGAKYSRELQREMRRGDRKIADDMARAAEPYLVAFAQDNSGKTAEELEQLAEELSPGGAHTGGTLVHLIWANLWWADPLLVAAIIRWNWHGGKAGFQFLPDPAQMHIDDYEMEAWALLELFDRALDGDPRRILTGSDREFFESLPDRFTIYRGCSGITAEQAATGVCWTTRRDVAEWFASRFSDETRPPILITAKINKTEVRLAKASEFEVVAMPRSHRALTCRPRGTRPSALEWKSEVASAAAAKPAEAA